MVKSIAESAELKSDEYESRILVSDDVGAAILGVIDEYDTVCVGLSQRTDGAGIPFGRITEVISRQATFPVAMIRRS